MDNLYEEIGLASETYTFRQKGKMIYFLLFKKKDSI